MKFITLFAILTFITGCSIKNSSSFSVEEINKCLSENKTNAIEVCKNKCNGDAPCEQRVVVIAKEKFGYEDNSPLTRGARGVSDELQEEIEKSTTLIEHETPQPPLSGGLPTESSEPTKKQEEENNKQAQTPDATLQKNESRLVNFSGVSCDNKEDLPEKMKVFAERVDIKKWHWVVPHSGVWELTELEPGEYKIYFAPNRNTEPLAKYSEFIADGSGSHDYKILDLTSGGDVKDIKPCDWE